MAQTRWHFALRPRRLDPHALLEVVASRNGFLIWSAQHILTIWTFLGLWLKRALSDCRIDAPALITARLRGASHGRPWTKFRAASRFALAALIEHRIYRHETRGPIKQGGTSLNSAFATVRSRISESRLDRRYLDSFTKSPWITFPTNKRLALGAGWCDWTEL